MRDFFDEIKRIIRINSVTANGNEELANYLHDQMRALGIKTQLQHVTHSIDGVSKRQFNVIGILGDPLVDKKTKKGLLLNTHLDTVGPGLPTNWTETGGDPFNATIKNGKVYGLGSADVKVDFLCKLRAVEKFREKKLKQPIYLVGTCGEEIGMFGARYLIKSGVLNPRYVICAEPSDLSLIYAHKSLNIFRVNINYQMATKDARGFNRKILVESYGKSAHGSYPHLGINAIHQLIDLIRDSMDQGYEMKFTRFEGGETVNKVADRALTELYLTAHQFEDYKRFLKDLITQTGMESSFKVESSGSDDVGIQFLPDSAFECATRISDHFRKTAHQFSKVTDSTYNPPHSTVNFGLLKQNQNGLEMHFDLRILPDQDESLIEKEILKDVEAIAAEFPKLNITASRLRTNPGLNMTLEHDFVRICKESMQAANIAPKTDKKATSTEAAQYFGAGYEAVVFGPGKSHGNSHSPNENNILEQLDQATTFYEKLIERVCL